MEAAQAPRRGQRYPSLSEAGASLGIDPAVLVSQINRLEREFGHHLLNRVAGQRAMQPTAYGQKIIAAIREASATRPAEDIGPRLRTAIKNRPVTATKSMHDHRRE